MEPRAYALFVYCLWFLICLSRADELKPGGAYPDDRVSKMNLPLSTFINQRSLVTDWSLVVLLRGENHYILNHKANREILSKPGVQGDMLVLDEAATSFLGWRRQNPETESEAFWESNPQLRKQTILYTSSATAGSGSATRKPAIDPSESQADRSSVPPLLSAHPASDKKAPEAKLTPAPSEEPTSSTAWSIIGVLIVAAGGLLWWLGKRRS